MLASMEDQRTDEVERYCNRLRSELRMISNGPVLAGPKMMAHIGSLLTLLDLHQANEFDLCVSCDRLWPCPTVVAVTGMSPQPDDDEQAPDPVVRRQRAQAALDALEARPVEAGTPASTTMPGMPVMPGATTAPPIAPGTGATPPSLLHI